MRAYSMDLRVRVLAACDDGMGTAEAADTFAVSPAWVRRLKQRRGGPGRSPPGPPPPARPPPGPRTPTGPGTWSGSAPTGRPPSTGTGSGSGCRP